MFYMLGPEAQQAKKVFILWKSDSIGTGDKKLMLFKNARHPVANYSSIESRTRRWKGVTISLNKMYPPLYTRSEMQYAEASSGYWVRCHLWRSRWCEYYLAFLSVPWSCAKYVHRLSSKGSVDSDAKVWLISEESCRTYLWVHAKNQSMAAQCHTHTHTATEVRRKVGATLE